MERQILSVDAGWWIVSADQQLWLPGGEIPHGSANQYGLVDKSAMLIGEWQDEPVWLVRHRRSKEMASLRQIMDHCETGLFQLAGRGVQLAAFYFSHQFCGYCGSRMEHSKKEWACLCPQCRERYYPQIAPCIIVAIRRGEEILLAQHQRHRSGLYTVLAGFVEVGETLEQTVAREVMEESGIRIKKVRYVASQPWPFPQSLMMGFMADYESGELDIDHHELRDAGWYRYDALPSLPAIGTVARRLIEDTVALCRNQSQLS